MNRKVIYNDCYGGFGLSVLAQVKLYELKNPGKKVYVYSSEYIADSENFEQKYTRQDGDLKDVKSFSAVLLLEDLGPEFIKASVFEKDHEMTELEQKFRDSAIYPDWGDIDRTDPDLVKVIEELGPKAASGDFSKLAIADIGESKYHIDEYDGWESVSTGLPEGYWQ
jgi:hypothetical protein